MSIALKLEEGEEKGERNETKPAGVTEEPGEKYSQVLTSVPKIKAKFFLTFQILEGRKYGKLFLGNSRVSLRHSALSMPTGPLAHLVPVPFFAMVVACRVWALQVGIAFYLCWLSREKISSC